MSAYLEELLDAVERGFSLLRKNELEIEKAQQELDALKKKHVVVRENISEEEGKSDLDSWLEKELERIANADTSRAEEKIEREIKQLLESGKEYRHHTENEMGHALFRAKHSFHDYLDHCSENMLNSPRADACRKRIEVTGLIYQFYLKVFREKHWSEYLVIDKNGWISYRKAQIRMKKLDTLAKFIFEPLP